MAIEPVGPRPVVDLKVQCMLHEIALGIGAATNFNAAIGNLDIVNARQRCDPCELSHLFQVRLMVMFATDLALGLRTDVADFANSEMAIEVWNTVRESDPTRSLAEDRLALEMG